MIAALIVQGVVFACVMWLVTRYLSERDRREARERQVLLQRIQAPEQAVVEHVQQHLPPDQPAVDPFDDDAFWEAKENMDRLLNEVRS